MFDGATGVASTTGNRVRYVMRASNPYARARAAALAKLSGLDVVEALSSDPDYGWSCAATGEQGYRRHTLFAEDGPSVKSRLACFFAYCRLDRRLPRADVVVVTGWHEPVCQAAILVARWRRSRVVMLSDSPAKAGPGVFLKEAFKRALVAQACGGVAAGTRSAANLVRLGLDQSRVFDGFDVVDNDYFAARATSVRHDESGCRSALSLPDRYVLVVARELPRKNVGYTVREFVRFVEERAELDGLHLVLVGGEHAGAMMQAPAALAHRIQSRPFLQLDELGALYALAECLVLASAEENWGLVVNEAMASGIPVLVSERCGCAEDLVLPGRTGERFEPVDGALVAAFDRLYAGDLRALGQAAHRHVATFSPDRFARHCLLAAGSA